MGQSVVNRIYSEGRPGDRANLNPTVYTVLNRLVAPDSTVKIASFVWEDSNGNWVNYGTGTPEGFVEAVQDSYIWNVQEEFINVLPAGSRVTVGRRGDYFAVSSNTPVSHKDIVYASTTDGSIQTAAVGAAAPSGHVNTGFVVLHLCEDDPNKFIMTSWDKYIAPAE